MLKAKVRSIYKQIWQEYEELFVPVTTCPPMLSTRTCIASSGQKQWPSQPSAEAFHGIAGEFVKLISPSSEADEASLLLQFLAGFGNVIGHSAHFKVEDDQHHLNLFIILVGRSSKGRKGVSWNRVRSFLAPLDATWNKDRIQSGLSSGEGLVSAVRDPTVSWSERQQVEVLLDQGVQDKRLMIIESEFASVFRVMTREGNTLSGLVRQAWDSGKLQILTKNNPLSATAPHISIIGHITEPDLKRYLSQTDAANGFGNRFLWACTQRSKLLPLGAKLDQFKLISLREKLDRAARFAKTTSQIFLADDAKERWTEIYGLLAEERDGLWGALTSRAEPQVLRMACIYALLDMSARIKVEHLNAALAAWHYVDTSVAYIFGNSLGDPVADQILANLRERSEGMTLSQIHGIFSRQKSAEQIQYALSALQGRKLAYLEREETAGRPIERWSAIPMQQKAE